jgi:hypothetical protein
MVAIAQARKGARLANPVADPTVQDAVAGIVRTKTSAQRRMDALTSDRLREAALAIGPGLKGQRDPRDPAPRVRLRVAAKRNRRARRREPAL